MVKTKRKTKKQLALEHEKEMELRAALPSDTVTSGSDQTHTTMTSSVPDSYKVSLTEQIFMSIAAVTLFGIVVTAIPWVLNAAFWLVKAFFEYWGWVNKLF